jgi:spermidine synthase
MVYGISTAGSIVGTLGTTFYLIPSIGTRAITLTLGTAGIVSALLLILAPRLTRQTAAPALVVLLAALACAAPSVRAEDLVNEALRAEMLKKKDGQVARIETEYNDIFITKRRSELTMSFQIKGWDYTESVTNLADADDLPVKYTRAMTIGVIYPSEPKKVLMLGLGGGSISTYLGRFMPDVAIDTVEIDPGVTKAAKDYFGIRETSRVRYFDADGRVYLNRNRQLYDLILVDAFQGGYVPFHLLTKEFYALLKQRLSPGGVAVFNVHDGTKLYTSTLLTQASVFGGVHVYPSGEGEAITVAVNGAPPADDVLAQRAAALQETHKFKFPLPALYARRIAMPSTKGGELLTDDFAPVNLYDTMGERQKKRK